MCDHNFEDKMERDTGTAKKTTEPVSPLSKSINEDTCVDDTRSSGVGNFTSDVARARWTLLRQVELALSKHKSLII